MFILTQIKVALLLFIVCTFILLPTCLIAIPFSLKRRLKIVCPVWAWCHSFLLRYACSAHIDIKEDHRGEEFKVIPTHGLYICNHQSFIDIPLIISAYQVPPIMKKEVLYVPMIGLLAWVCGAMPVSRGKAGSRNKVFTQTKKRMVDDQIGVQVYPEGTRSKDSFPKPYDQIKRTLIVFAYKENIPVIATSIYGTRGVMSSEGWVKPGRHIGIIVHKEIYPKDYANTEDFCRACWDKVVQGHDEMRAKLHPLNASH